MFSQDKIEQRIVDLTFSDTETVYNYLNKIIIDKEIRLDNGVIVIHNNHLNFGCGIDMNNDPITRCIMICMAISGIYWSFVFPNVLKKVDQRWKEEAKKTKKQQNKA